MCKSDIIIDTFGEVPAALKGRVVGNTTTNPISNYLHVAHEGRSCLRWSNNCA